MFASALCVFLAVAVPGVQGCGDEQSRSVVTEVIAKTPTFKDSPRGWAGKAQETTTVATVNGVPISLKDLQYQAEKNPDANADVLLRAAVDAEVLAQAAVGMRLNEDRQMIQRYKRFLANAYLEDVFEAETTPESIPLRLVEAAYLRNQRFYDRAPAHTMVHLQIVCCAPVRGVCEDDGAPECYADTFPIMQDVYKQASTALKDALDDPRSMAVAMESLGTELQSQYPRLAFGTSDFYYDPTLTHEEQLGRYNMMDEAIATALFKIPIGHLTQPVRTPWGWHVAALVRTWPERRDTLDKPEVVQDVRTKALPAYMRVAFARELDKAAKAARVEIFADRLLMLDEAMGATSSK